MSLPPANLYGRRRLRADGMAAELSVSIRKFRELLTLGMPHTRLEGILWFEPEKVHQWLDQFERKGAPGIERTKGIKLPPHEQLPRKLGTAPKSKN